MTSIDDFQNYWFGKRVDYDGVYRFQCVDLILQYLSQVYGIHSGVWGNAIDYWNKPTGVLLQHFDKLPADTPIQKGDIIVFKPTITNEFGHIAIAVDGNTMLEQNGATGDGDGAGGDEIRYRAIPKERIAGILRWKGASMDEIKKLKEILSLREDWLNKIAYAAGVDPNNNPIEGDDVAQIIANIDRKNKRLAELEGGDCQKKLDAVRKILA